VFVDADVVVNQEALPRLAARFVADPDLGAAFGAYDEEPADPGFFSQCRNLAHSFIHQRSNREANTFWAGLGAVRAGVFLAVGGLDERFARPSVEDIDLGYRIRAAGFRIVLDPSGRGKHLKRWTLWTSLVTDVRDRGVPWTQLLARSGRMHDDLNLTVKYRLAVAAAYGLAFFLVAAFWQPVLLWAVPALLAALWYLDRPYYRFFARRRGVAFTLGWFPFHILHHLCNGLSFVLGTGLYLGQRWTGVALPGALPLTPWPPVRTGVPPPDRRVSPAAEAPTRLGPGGGER
jgi:GT2 family glycosyltransferase